MLSNEHGQPNRCHVNSHVSQTNNNPYALFFIVALIPHRRGISYSNSFPSSLAIYSSTSHDHISPPSCRSPLWPTPSSVSLHSYFSIISSIQFSLVSPAMPVAHKLFFLKYSFLILPKLIKPPHIFAQTFSFLQLSFLFPTSYLCPTLGFIHHCWPHKSFIRFSFYLQTYYFITTFLPLLATSTPSDCNPPQFPHCYAQQTLESLNLSTLLINLFPSLRL